VYKITCGICGERYIGESKRELSTRVEEHASHAQHKIKKEPWGLHYATHHPKARASFSKIEVIATIQDVIARKIREAIEIRQQKPEINISSGYQLS